ncbi:MAG: hypothetical protein ACO3FO_06280, partial [Candidatus Nanopelagicaceae bacterium]
LGTPDHIVSRNENDNRSGGTLKIEGLRRIFKLYSNLGYTFNDAVFYEDNVAYLKAVCDYFNIRGVYVPSKQGH